MDTLESISLLGIKITLEALAVKEERKQKRSLSPVVPFSTTLGILSSLLQNGLKCVLRPQ